MDFVASRQVEKAIRLAQNRVSQFLQEMGVRRFLIRGSSRSVRMVCNRIWHVRM